MLEKYIHEGKTYEVSADQLDVFLAEHPGAEKYSEKYSGAGNFGFGAARGQGIQDVLDRDLPKVEEEEEVDVPEDQYGVKPEDDVDILKAGLVTIEGLREEAGQPAYGDFEAAAAFPSSLTDEQKASNAPILARIDEQRKASEKRLNTFANEYLMDVNGFSGNTFVQDATGNISLSSVEFDGNYDDLLKDFKKRVNDTSSMNWRVYNGMEGEDIDRVFGQAFATALQKEDDNDAMTSIQKKVDAGIKQANDENRIYDIEYDSIELNKSHRATYGGYYGSVETERNLAEVNHLLENFDETGTNMIFGKPVTKDELMATRDSLVSEIYTDEDREYKMFYDFENNRMSYSYDNVPESKQERLLDTTNLFQMHLAKYGSSGRQTLAAENELALFEQAGLNIQGQEIISVKLNDANLVTRFEKYYNEETKAFDVPLSAFGGVVGEIERTSEFLSPRQNVYADFTNIKPVDFEGKPYSNENEFVDYVNDFYTQKLDVENRVAALWKLYHLNEDITTIGDSKGGRFIRSMLQGFGYKEGQVTERIGYTDAAIQDIVVSEFVDTDKDGNMYIGSEKLDQESSEYLERDWADKGVEMVGGVVGITPYFIGLNKAQGALGVTKLISNLITSTNKWKKGTGLLLGAITEDVKMREGMGLIAGEDMQFERGVGAGFFFGGRLMPGAQYWKTATKYPILNTVLESTFKNGPSFVIANDFGEFANAVYDDKTGGADFQTYINEQWSDYTVIGERALHSYLMGKMMGLGHMKRPRIRRGTDGKVVVDGGSLAFSYKGAAGVRDIAMTKANELQTELVEIARQEGVNVENPAELDAWFESQAMVGAEHGTKVSKYNEYSEEATEAAIYLMQADNAEAWTDKTKAGLLYQKHFDPLIKMFEARGKKLIIELVDDTIEQEYQDPNDLSTKKQDAKGLYIRLEDVTTGTDQRTKDKDTAKITINVNKSKGRGTISHEGLHAFLDIMFDGRPSLKNEFKGTLENTLKQIKLADGSNLLEFIEKDPAIKGEQMTLEEMMAYTAEALSKKENQYLMNNDVFSTLAGFFNKVSVNTFGKKGDFYTRQSLVDMLGRYGRSGDIKYLESLTKDNTYIEQGTEKREGVVASRPVESVKETLDALEKQKKELIAENIRLNNEKPEGYQEIMKRNSDRLKGTDTELGINEKIKELKNVADEGNPRTKINNNLSRQVRNEKGELEYESKYTKEELKEGEGQEAYRKTLGELLTSRFVENMLFEGMRFRNRNSNEAQQYLDLAKDQMEKRLKQYDPEVNSEVFGWLTGVGGGEGKSMLFRIKGDALRDYNKIVGRAEKEVVEGYENLFGKDSAPQPGVAGETQAQRRFFTETVEFSEAEKEAIDATSVKAREDGVNVEDLSYKEVKKLLKGEGRPPTSSKDVKITGALAETLRIVSDKFGVPIERVIANQTLSGKIRTSARDYIKNNAQELIDALPEGTTPSGKSTGIANTKLGEFYVKQGRVSMAKTGSAEGLAEQVKKEVSTQDFLDMFGINANGSYAKGTKFDGAIKELIIQTASITANQSARKTAGKMEAKVGEGRGEAMASLEYETFVERFDEFKQDKETPLDLLYKYFIGDRKNIDSKYLNFLDVAFNTAEGLTREQAVDYAIMHSETDAGKTAQKPFNKGYTDVAAKSKQVGGVMVTGEQINNINLSRVWRRKDGNIIVDVDRANQQVDYAVELAKLLPKELAASKTAFGQYLGLHTRTNLERFTLKTEAKKAEKGVGVFDLNGNSIVGQEFTKGNERAQAVVGENTYEVWDGVDVKYTSAPVQAAAQKRYANAKDGFEQAKILETSFSEISEANKVEVHNSLISTFEYFVHEAKTAEDFLGRLEYVVGILKGNSNLRLGLRQTVPVIAVFKELLQGEGVKLEHLKASLNQSLIEANLIKNNEWRSSDAKSLNDFVGITAPKSLLDIIDAKGGLTNKEVLFRLAVLEPQMLEKFVTIESKGKETLLDYALREGRKEIIRRSMDRQGLKQDINGLRKMEAKLRKTGLLAQGEKIGQSLASRTIENHNKALELGRKKLKERRGMSTFDFDETLIIQGENFVTANRGKETKRITSEEFPIEGPRLAAEGWQFDFKDFVNVKGGVEGPLFKKLQNQITKYGNENVFVLTARMQESAPAIHAWLKSKGVNLPIENITGLGNSTGEAKARWMLEKFAEGYNDMYFVDDALPNVEAVKKVLGQLDVKSNVQQALASRDFNKEVNKIMESTFGIDANKTFSKAEGRMRGKDKKRRRLFLPDSASDLELLLEPLYGKGAEGIKDKQWFSENFYKKFERGINEYNTAKQRLTTEYMQLRKNNKQTVKDLSKEVPGTSFTNDMAIRVFLWDKAGFTIPDLAATTKKKLVDHVQANPRYRRYAESVARMTGIETGLKEPNAEWWSETLATEISDANRGVGRKEYLSDFIEARQEIFSEANLNKMESQLGKDWRDNIEDMFDRMETGRTRSEKLTGITGDVINYFNGSIGAIMNFNTRSAVLQLISTANFVNMSFNNPARAAQAFSNQPQYWADFMRIMNSDMLKQRRGGLEINVTEAEIAAAAKESKNPAKAVMAKIMKAGYLPTKWADSFAIAAGGATYYRNSIRKYMKEGMSKAEAEKKAFIDFQAIAERTQQSSRPDLISREQTTLAGRLILPFANTPLQMNRLAMREMLDIYNGRYKGAGELTNKLGKIGYCGFVQTLFFAGLQSAAFAIFGNSEDDELKAKKQGQMIDTVVDSGLRGMGIKGAILNGVVNAAKELETQAGKDYGADYSEVAEDLLNISPPIGSKFRKLDAAGNTYKYNKKQIDEEGIEFSLDSPGLQAATQVTEAITNLPANRIFKKANNVKNAMSDEYEPWQRFLMFLGWSNWDVAPDQAKDQAKGKKKQKKKQPTEITFEDAPI